MWVLSPIKIEKWMTIEPNFTIIPGVDKSNFLESRKKIDQDQSTTS